MKLSHRQAAYLLLGVGLLLVLSSAVIRLFFSTRLPLAVAEEPCLAFGLLMMLAAMFPAQRARATTALGICLSIVTLIVTIFTVEVAGRAVGFDFRRQEVAMRKLPPYYRQPRVPLEPAFFRRTGPQEWTGQVIRTWLLSLRLSDEAYRDEPIVTVRYDANGFRNDPPLEDWEVAIAGDSFTELGYLPQEQLFTTQLMHLTGWRVLNLGVSMTGPFTQLAYLRTFGISPSLRHTVIVFFEGNDIQDMDAEFDALRTYENTGVRPFRRIQKQTSLLAALSEWLVAVQHPIRPIIAQLPVYSFESQEGEIPVTIWQVGPALRDLGPTRHQAWDLFLERYREFGESHGVATWLAFMPCKGRVLHDRLKPLPEAEDSPVRPWSPTRLPEWIAESCQRHGVRYLDLTPALQRVAIDHGELVYNPIIDTHLNARGSAIVARELAVALR